MATSQTCKLQVDCLDKGTYNFTDLVLTKTFTKKGPQERKTDFPNVKMANINKIRRRTAANKRSIAEMERRIKHVEDVNKMSVEGINDQLRQQLLLNAELSNKLQDLNGR